jgi:hypothetical protein
MLAALDVREYFDNYLPSFAPPTDAVRNARNRNLRPNTSKCKNKSMSDSQKAL